MGLSSQRFGHLTNGLEEFNEPPACRETPPRSTLVHWLIIEFELNQHMVAKHSRLGVMSVASFHITLHISRYEAGAQLRHLVSFVSVLRPYKLTGKCTLANPQAILSHGNRHAKAMKSNTRILHHCLVLGQAHCVNIRSSMPSKR